MELLFFDSTAETDVVRRFPTSAKVFVSASRPPTWQPRALTTQPPRFHIYIIWIKRREVVVGAKRIRNKKLREHQYRKVCGSVRVGGKNPMSVWWSNEIKAAVGRGEAAWKVVLVADDEEAREVCTEAYREEKRKVKRCIYQSKMKVNE